MATSYTYDAASQLLSLAHQFGATTINSFAYTYDKVGNRKSKADNAGTANYTYDVLNRLTQAVNPLPSNPLETFNYDPVGNRANSNQNGASIFNTANQLLEDANFTYQYDNNGNMIQKTAKIGGAVTIYEYDAENKLVRVVSSNITANYKYDGLGRRVEKEVVSGSATTTRYVYDNEDILLELNGSNNIVARYTHGPGIDEPLIMEKSGASFYYHADGLGSITEMTNQTGIVAQRYTYSSFGKLESQLDPNIVQPHTFTSRELDSETGLHFYRKRYYDSSTGRFLQEDPITFLSGDSNFYRYVRDNPVIYTDPSGLYLSSLHTSITLGVMRGMNFPMPMANQVASYSGLSDWNPTWQISQAVENAHWHGMRPPWLTPEQARDLTERFISRMIANCDLESLGRAIHAGQDTTAPGHQGWQEYTGTVTREHMAGDAFPPSENLASAQRITFEIIIRWQRQCACQ